MECYIDAVPEQWFSKETLEDCDGLVRNIYGADAVEEAAEEKEEEGKKSGGSSELPMPQPALLHWHGRPLAHSITPRLTLGFFPELSTPWFTWCRHWRLVRGFQNGGNQLAA